MKSKTIPLICLLVIGLALGYFFGHNTKLQLSTPITEGKIKGAAIQPSPSPCNFNSGEMVSNELANSEKKVFNDPAAVQIIHTDCLGVFGAFKADLEQSGAQNLVFWGSGAGCGSCHTQTVYVLSGTNTIFRQVADDPMVEIIKDHDGKDFLSIIEPLRKINESLAAPTWGVKTEYAWSSDSQSFFSLNATPYSYSEHKSY